jgi:hypothetical protein
MSTSPPEPRVAVIAVHGVANQAPGDSAEAIAALLLSRSDGEAKSKTCYEPFQWRTIYVPVAPARAGGVAADFVKAELTASGKGITPEAMRDEKTDKPGFGEKVAEAFQESKPGYRATLQEGSQTATDADAGLIYMRSLLGSYNGQAGRQSYKTLRLEGKRCDAAGRPGPSVDVYEVYWADLSQLGSGPVRVFSALYQLVLHISELGRRALEDGFSEFGSDKRWTRLVKYQELAVRQLTVAIPLFNLVLLATFLAAMLVGIAGDTGSPNIAAATGVGSRLGIAAILGMVILLVGGAYWYAGKVRRPSTTQWWLIPIVSIFAGAGIGYGLVSLSGQPGLVLLGEGWIVAGFGMNALLKKYDSVRPGALASGRLIVLMTAVLFLVALIVAFQELPSRQIEYAALWTLQILNVLLSFFWTLVVLSALYAFWLGQRIVSSLRGPKCSRARAAIRTSRLTLGISAGSMLGILVIVWSGFTAWGVAHVHTFDCMETTIFPWLRGLDWIVADPSTIARWLGNPAQCAGTTLEALTYFRAVLLMGVTSGLPVSLFLVTICVLLLTWMAMPSVRFEGDSPSKCTNADSEKAGIWLSRGLDATRVITFLWWSAVFVVVLIFGIGDVLSRQVVDLEIFRVSRGLAIPILGGVGTIVAASAAAIAYGFARFGGSALDVVLDVDNYLRELPAHAPPRALIAERFVSLLRYVANDRGKTGRPYDSIIFVAYSLGALITCDLLRFFVSETKSGRGDEALESLGYGVSNQARQPDIPIHLFTMGNPLRQLLNRFFPHQYRWVRESPDNAMPPAVVAEPERFSTPSSDALGVESWTNAYRSGDYVGRGLWLGEWFKRTRGADTEGGYPQKIEVYGDGRVSEMCIGLGAHTHYWDETAPDIRDELDRLILGSSKGSTQPTSPGGGVTPNQPYPSGLGTIHV